MGEPAPLGQTSLGALMAASCEIALWFKKDADRAKRSKALQRRDVMAAAWRPFDLAGSRARLHRADGKSENNLVNASTPRMRH
jgi:hypothetical protein